MAKERERERERARERERERERERPNLIHLDENFIKLEPKTSHHRLPGGDRRTKFT